MLTLSGAWLCGLYSVPQGSGLSRLRSSFTLPLKPESKVLGSVVWKSFICHRTGLTLRGLTPDGRCSNTLYMYKIDVDVGFSLKSIMASTQA